MVINLRAKFAGVTLNDLEARRIERQLERLEPHLEQWPDPIVTLRLTPRPDPPGVTARLRARAGHLGGHVVSRESADTADQAVNGAVAQLLRQLERQDATRRDRGVGSSP